MDAYAEFVMNSILLTEMNYWLLVDFLLYTFIDFIGI